MNTKWYGTLAALALLAPSASLQAEAPVEGAEASKEKKPALARLLKSADANSDQKLDLAEIHTKLPNFPAERFGALDKNQDGFLEAGELPERPKMEGEPAGNGDGAGKLRAADADKDGKISEAEFTAGFPGAAVERFKNMDKNQDGFVEPGETGKGPKAEAEAGAGGRGEIGAKLRAADTDQDGKLSQAEYTAGFPNAPVERFAALDRNSDGFVDRSDREGADAAVGEIRKKKAEGGARPGKGALGDAAPYVQGLISDHDADKDGKLTKAELEAAKPGFPEKTFAAIDRDNDGAITSADVPPSAN